MKKVLLSIFTLSFFLSNAQFVIEESDFATIGDVVIYARDSAFNDNSSQLSIKGDNATWDFTNLGMVTEDTVFFSDPANHPAGNVFGAATMSYNDDINENFMKMNASGMDILGYATDLSNFVDTSMLPGLSNLPSVVIFQYDGSGLFYLDLEAEYGDMENGNVHGDFTAFYGDSFNVPGMGNVYIDSFRINEDVTFSSEIDGSGTLKMPDGDYYVIRQNINYVQDITIEILINISPIPSLPFYVWQQVPGVDFTIDETNYRYFGMWQKFPVLEISIEANGAFTTSRYQSDPHGSQVGLDERLQGKSFVTSKDGALHVQSPHLIQSYEILDMTGKVVQSSSLNRNFFSAPLETKGLYFVRLKTANGMETLKAINQ